MHPGQSISLLDREVAQHRFNEFEQPSLIDARHRRLIDRFGHSYSLDVEMQLSSMFRRASIVSVDLFCFWRIASQKGVEQSVLALSDFGSGVVKCEGGVVIEQLLFERLEEGLIVFFVFRIVGADLCLVLDKQEDTNEKSGRTIVR